MKLWEHIIERGVKLSTQKLYMDVELKMTKCTLNLVILLEHLSYLSWWDEIDMAHVLDVLLHFLHRPLPKSNEYQTLSHLHERWKSLHTTIRIFHPLIFSYGNLEKLVEEKEAKNVTEYKAIWLLEQSLTRLDAMVSSMNLCMEKELEGCYMLVEHMAIPVIRTKHKIQDFFQGQLIQNFHCPPSSEVDFQIWALKEIYQEKNKVVY